MYVRKDGAGPLGRSRREGSRARRPGRRDRRRRLAAAPTCRRDRVAVQRRRHERSPARGRGGGERLGIVLPAISDTTCGLGEARATRRIQRRRRGPAEMSANASEPCASSSTTRAVRAPPCGETRWRFATSPATRRDLSPCRATDEATSAAFESWARAPPTRRRVELQAHPSRRGAPEAGSTDCAAADHPRRGASYGRSRASKAERIASHRVVREEERLALSASSRRRGLAPARRTLVERPFE